MDPSTPKLVWKGIIEPVAPPALSHVDAWGYVALGCVVVSLALLRWRMSRPRVRADAQLRRVARQLAREHLAPRLAAQSLARALCDGLVVPRLSAHCPPSPLASSWQVFAHELAAACYAPTPPEYARVVRLCTEARQWLRQPGLDRD